MDREPQHQPTEDPRLLLIKAGLPQAAIRSVAEVLACVDSLDELEREFVRRGMTCDPDQFMLPYFRPFFLELPDVQNRTMEALTAVGVSGDIARAYILELGTQPRPLLDVEYSRDELPMTVRSPLVNTARGQMFLTLKSLLVGVGSTPSAEAVSY